MFPVGVRILQQPLLCPTDAVAEGYLFAQMGYSMASARAGFSNAVRKQRENRIRHLEARSVFNAGNTRCHLGTHVDIPAE
jgi:hypothetical protein